MHSSKSTALLSKWRTSSGAFRKPPVFLQSLCRTQNEGRLDYGIETPSIAFMKRKNETSWLTEMSVSRDHKSFFTFGDRPLWRKERCWQARLKLPSNSNEWLIARLISVWGTTSVVGEILSKSAKPKTTSFMLLCSANVNVLLGELMCSGWVSASETNCWNATKGCQTLLLRLGSNKEFFWGWSTRVSKTGRKGAALNSLLGRTGVRLQEKNDISIKKKS